jgi:hypothetical protein
MISKRDLYRSSSGDTWTLFHDSSAAKLFVRHVPNAPSGGRVEDLDLATFLNGSADAPERRALLDLIAGTTTPEGPENPVALPVEDLNSSNDE